MKASGSGDALLRPRPLRTGRARFPGTTAQASPEDDEVSASASWLVHRPSGKDLPSAVRVEEPVKGPGLAVDLFDDVLFGQHPPDGHEPLFPLAWAAWFVLGVQKEFPANGTASALASQKPGGVLIHGRRALYSSLASVTQFTAWALVVEPPGRASPLWQGRTMPFDHNDHYLRLLLRQVPRNCGAALDVGCGTGRFARRLAHLGRARFRSRPQPKDPA